MNANNFTPVEPEENLPSDLHLEEEKLSSGNGRLAIIVGVILAVVVLGYVLLPAKATHQIVSAMPGVELGDATVTGTRPTEEAPATPEAAPAALADAPKPTAAAKPTPGRAAAPAAGTETAVAPAAAEVEIEPVPAAAPVAEAAPENVTLTGRILDENGRPMAGATVMVKGTRKAVGTDANGNYTLEVPAGDNTLVYGYGGYQDQEVHARGTQLLNVTLLPSENAGRRRRK